MDALGQVGRGGTLSSLIERLMAVERQRFDALLLKRTEIAGQRSSLDALSSLLSTLRTKVSARATGAGITPRYDFHAGTSDAEKVTATAGPGGLVGSYSVEVNQLAAAHSQASVEYTLDATSFGAGSYSFDITVGGTATRVDVEIGAGDDDETVLNAVATALNESGAEVVASVTTTHEADGKAKLVVRAREAGTANAIDSITDVTGNLAASLGFTTAQAAADALIKVDSVEVTASTNTIDGVIPGVSLHLVSITNAAGADPAPVTIDVTGDREGVKAAVEDFIATYNNAIAEVRSAATEGFRNDPVLLGLPGQLVQSLARRVGGLGDEVPSTLIELGVTFNGDGTLSLSNVSRLYEAIDEHGVGAVAAIFNADGETSDTQGIAARLETLLDGFLSGPRDVGGHDLAGPINLIRRQLDTRERHLDTRIRREEDRLERYEWSLRQRYARIQELIGDISAQSAVTSQYYNSIYGA